MAKLTLDIELLPFLKDNVITNKVKDLKDKIGKQLSGVEIEVEVDDGEVKKSFKKIPKEAKSAGDEAGKGFGNSFSNTVKKLIGAAAIFSVFAMGASAVKNAAGEFKDFNAQLQNVESLGVKNVAGLGKALNELSKTTVDTTSNLTKGLYQSISAGITGTQKELVGFVEQASRVAVAGNATTEAAVDSLTTVMNAYKLQVGEAGKVSDIFFGAIKGGKTDFAQLNSSLASVIPAASAAGISFEELAGNIAQMTALGTPTAQATTQLRAAIIELQKPGKDLADVMSGVTVTVDGVSQSLSENNIAQVLKQQGLTATLQQIEQAATASGKSMTQAFSSSEAASAALLLTGENAETANKQLQNIKKGIEEGVSTSAFEAQFKSLDNQMKLVKNNIQAGFNTIFTAILPIVNNLLQTIIPIISQLFDGIIPIIENLASVIGPLLNNVMTLIQPLIDLLASQLAPLLTSIIGKIVGLIGPLAELFAPIFAALSAVFEQISPILEQLYTILTDGLGEAIRGLVPLITLLATTLGGILGDVLELVLGLIVELVTNNLELINVVVELINALLPVIQIVLQLAASLIKLGVSALKPLLPMIADVIGLVAMMTTKIIGAVIAIGEFFGLIDKKKPEAPFKKVSDSAKDTTIAVQGMNETIAAPTPVTNIEKTTTAVKATGKAVKDNTKYAVEYFKTFEKAQSEALRMAGIEEEITRIRQERSKSTADELVEQQREIDAMLDRKTKLERSLKDGFVTDELGKKIKITAEEKVDLTETLANLDTDLKFASKNLEKLDVKIEIDKRAAEREAKLTIAELQRERLEIEVDMGIKPKTDLLKAYENDLVALNVAIAGVEGVEQEKLQNDKLKKIRQIKSLQDELNKQAADNAALAYANSFNAVIDNFQDALTGAFDNIQPDNSRISAIGKEIEAIDKRKKDLLKYYQEGTISAQQYNSSLVEIEKDRVNKVNELNDIQFSRIDILTTGLGNAFGKLSDQYKTMALESINSLKGLSKKELEYQKTLKEGGEITADLAKSHEDYSSKAQEAMQQMIVSAGSAFASMVLQGKNVAKSFALIALDALDSIIPILVAQIFGQALAQLGPIGGAIAAATGIGLLKGLAAIAKSSIGGASTGVFELNESNKSRPGNGDEFLMMLRRRETVVTPEISDKAPVVKALVRDGMSEDEYFFKYKLPQFLSKHKISMPSMGLNLVALDSKNSIEMNNESARKLQLIDERFTKIDKERLSIAVQRESVAQSENNQLTKELISEVKLLRRDNQVLTTEVKSLKREFGHNTNVEIVGQLAVKGEDLETVIKKRNRRKVF